MYNVTPSPKGQTLILLLLSEFHEFDFYTPSGIPVDLAVLKFTDHHYEILDIHLEKIGQNQAVIKPLSTVYHLMKSSLIDIWFPIYPSARFAFLNVYFVPIAVSNVQRYLMLSYTF